MQFPSLDSKVIVANALLKIFSVEKLLFQSKINQLGSIEITVHFTHSFWNDHLLDKSVGVKKGLFRLFTQRSCPARVTLRDETHDETTDKQHP